MVNEWHPLLRMLLPELFVHLGKVRGKLTQVQPIHQLLPNTSLFNQQQRVIEVIPNAAIE
jgi:hypothetical protein